MDPNNNQTGLDLVSRVGALEKDNADLTRRLSDAELALANRSGPDADLVRRVAVLEADRSGVTTRGNGDMGSLAIAGVDDVAGFLADLVTRYFGSEVAAWSSTEQQTKSRKASADAIAADEQRRRDEVSAANAETARISRENSTGQRVTDPASGNTRTDPVTGQTYYIDPVSGERVNTPGVVENQSVR